MMLRKLFKKPVLSEEQAEEEDTFPEPEAMTDNYSSPFAMVSQKYRPKNRRSSFGGIPRGGVDMTTPNEKVMDLLDRLLEDEPVAKPEIVEIKTLLKKTSSFNKPTDLRQQLVSKYSDGREDVGNALSELIGERQVPALMMDRVDSARSERPLVRQSRDVPRNLMKAETLWDFDAFALDHSTYHKPVETLTLHLIRLIADVESINIDFAKLQRYLQTIESGHYRNPYHGPPHVASVVQRMHILMRHGLMQSGLLTPLSSLACYIAAAVHDYGHTGFTNDYLVQTQHPFAMTYNDIACHENYHCFASMKLLIDTNMSFLKKKEDIKELRRLVILMVLETDMARHFESTERFKSLPQEILLGRDRDIVFKQAMKCADLSHCGVSFPIHKRWVEMLNKEFWAQGDMQKQRGLPVSPLMSREGPGLPSTQAGFIEIIVMPMFQAFVDRFPETQPMLTYAQRNLESWQKELAS